MTNDASQWLLALEREQEELGDLRYRYSALYSAVRFLLEQERGTPITATNDAKVRNVLNEVVTNGEWTNGEQCGDWKISKAVYEMAVEARDMLDMTKLYTDDEMAERLEATAKFLREAVKLIPMTPSYGKSHWMADSATDCEQAAARLRASTPSPHGAASSSEIAEAREAVIGAGKNVAALREPHSGKREMCPICIMRDALSKLAELEGKAP